MGALAAKKRAEDIDHDMAVIDPFHTQVVEELRHLQRRCKQDFKALARRAAKSSAGASATTASFMKVNANARPVNTSGPGASSSSRSAPLDDTPPLERSPLGPSTPLRGANAPLELETLSLQIVPENNQHMDGANGLACPHDLTELAAQVDCLSRQLSRLGVPCPAPPAPPP